jgi:glycosyltransferase involved in cell wall biosynthesis
MLVTVMINNYNYAPFLPAAIDSALAQTHRPIQVVVVDDGSSDASRSIIAAYGDRVEAVYKENGGQASAINAGFTHSRGEIVTLLDADDLLDETLVARVVAAFAAHPDAGLVQARLELADATGARIGRFMPPSYVRMPTRDFRRWPTALNNVSWWAPTSGISVTSSILARVLPLPEELFRISADIGLVRACALCAPVVSLSGPGGRYRSHGGNYYNRGELDVRKLESDVRRFADFQRYVRTFAQEAGVEGYPDDGGTIDDTVFAIQRLLLVRLGDRQSRLPGDTRMGTGLSGMRATLRRPDVGLAVKLPLVAWFGLMTALPRPLAERFANRTLFQQNLRAVKPRAR